MDKDEQIGMIYTAMAYLIWGLIPIYWKILDYITPGEILAQRIIWSFIFLFILILFSKKWKPFMKQCKEILQDKNKSIRISMATLFISINWLVFIWAVNSEYVVQVSLGYYINPLISILLGMIILKEKTTKRQNIAFILAGIGVLYLTLSLGSFPWVAIILALTFAFYGLLKKLLNLNSMFSLTIETMIVTPIALIYILFLPRQHFQITDLSLVTNWLFIGAGIVTAIPLLLFGSGAKHIPLAMVGILQYIAPTLILIIGVFLYNEAFTSTHAFAFLFIWTALLIYMSSHLRRPVKKWKGDKLKEAP